MPGNPIATFAPPTVITDAATQVIDCTAASYFVWTLGANRAVSAFANPIGGQIVHLEVMQDATGARVLTWPSNVSWPGGVAPTLSVAAAAVDALRFVWNPTANKWRGAVNGLAYA